MSDKNDVKKEEAVCEEKILVTSLSIEPPQQTITVGGFIQLNAKVLPENATNKEIFWESANPDVITVIPKKGLAYAHAPGRARIYASTTDGSEIIKRCVLRVTVFVESVMVNYESKTMAIDSAIRMQAGVVPGSATNQKVLWSSGDENIVTVDENTGYAVAKNPGTTNIWAVSQDVGHRYASCSITVRDLFDVSGDSWMDMGFKYGISSAEVARKEEGKPPSSYETWILNGRQKVILLRDQNDPTILEDIRLLIRSDEGIWHKIGFREKAPSKVYIECVKISEDEKNAYLAKENTDYIFLYGDYRESMEYIMYCCDHAVNIFAGKYNVVHKDPWFYINEILTCGININQELNRYVKESRRSFNDSYYEDLKSIIENNSK